MFFFFFLRYFQLQNAGGLVVLDVIVCKESCWSLNSRTESSVYIRACTLVCVCIYINAFSVTERLLPTFIIECDDFPWWSNADSLP